MAESAIVISAGVGKEDRLMSGSYVALRDAEQAQRAAEQHRRSQPMGDGDGYLPDFLQ